MDLPDVSRRRLLGGVAALGGGVPMADRAGADPRPPPEAYQPAATKNWWYFNGHLFDPENPSEPRYDLMGAYVMEHGGDTAGHIQLFTFVENDDPEGLRVGESTNGVVQPSTDNYAAYFRSPDATGHVVRTDDGDPQRWLLYMDPEAPVSVELQYASTYEPKLHENYREGGGVGNVVFWNQATLEGRVRTPDGVQPVVGVGFLEHVWGAWSRVPQKGVDYLNVHLETESGPPKDRDENAEKGPAAGAPADDLPTWGSVYCRRTFYHGAPTDPDAESGRPVLEDVGPDLYLTVDGETWHEATDLSVYVTEPDGDRVEQSEHRRGRPVAVDLEAAFEDGGALSLSLDALPDATIPNPHELASVGNVHEGAATVEGTVRLPGEHSDRRVSGVAQTEHQRYGPQYPY